MGVLRLAGVPAALLLISFLLVRRMGLEVRKDVGFRAPRLLELAAWSAGFAVLFFFNEWLGRQLGFPNERGAWAGKYEGIEAAGRAVFVGLLYPFAEEVLFRGALFGRLMRLGGARLAVPITAAAFALAHIQYDWVGMTLVGMDALYYSTCRWRTGSVWPSILFHAAGNSYAVWERLAG